MKAYEQLESFKASRMGTKRGWALANARMGFNIPVGRYASARADMEAQKKAHTLHKLDTLPQGVSVPIYCEPKIKKLCTVSRSFGYVFVITKRGRIYAEGKIQSKKWLEYMSENNKLYWGEFCDGVRIVREVK